MSVKVPYGSVEYQSHHHCQCDFCDSRRKVGAKKFALSSAIAKQKAQQNQHNCCCPGHDASAKQPLSGNGTPSFELDDPEHHINQTELNAKMGRTGLPDGNQYTTAVGGTRGLRGAGESGTANAKTREEREEEKMEELDRLERLLILEHKARAKATADAEILSLRQSTGRGPCPKPLEAVPPLPVEDGMDQTMQGTGAHQAGTARETQENAHESFVASARDGRELARESMNQPQNNAAFGRSSQIGGAGGTTTRQVNSLQADASAAKGAGNSTVKRPWDYFGPRPEGAGVVWRKIQPSIPEDTTTGVGGLGNVDNRHLWKKTLLKGSSAKENTANANSKKTADAAPDPSIMSPGALAALSLQKQQENDHQARDAVGSPIPTVWWERVARDMIRDQCKAYCQCSCKQSGEQMRGIPDSIKLASGKGRSRDELYLRTLNQTLRARSLMASSKNACKFKPDEILQSTRGDMARAALTVPVRRRDRLQELLILENKERIKAERQRRQNLRAMGLPDDADKTLRDCAVGTRDDFDVARELGKTNEAEVVVPQAHSADEDLRHVLNTVKAITDEHDARVSSKSLTSDQIHRLRRLVQEHDNKRKNTTADSPLQPHVADHRHQVSQPHIQQKMFPSIHDRSTRRLKYNSHPYGTGVVWLPLEEDNTDEDGKNATFTAAGRLDNTRLDDKAYAEHQYPGGTYNKYLNDGPKAAEGTTLNDASPSTADNLAASADPKILEKGNNAENVALSDAERKKSLKEKPSYKSSAAFWRTTNQDRAAQMQRFLEFKKLQADAARVYAESAVRRPADVGTADAVAAGD